MDPSTPLIPRLLAQASNGSAAGGGSGAGETANAIMNGDLLRSLDVLHDPQPALDYLGSMPWIFSATIVTLGILCVLNGYQWHKWVVASLAFLAGIALGKELSATMGKPMIVATALGALFAIIATPLLRITVAIFGGLVGAFIGANVWLAAEVAPSSQNTEWAGAAIGFVVVAMLSMLMFRLVVVLFTSVGGAVMVVFGSLTLLMQVEGWNETVSGSLTDTPALVPLLTLLAAVGGFVLQESRLRSGGVKVFQSDAAAAAERQRG